MKKLILLCIMLSLSCDTRNAIGPNGERILQESFSPRYNSFKVQPIALPGYEWQTGPGFLVYFVVVNTSDYNWYGYPELIVHEVLTEPTGDNILSRGEGVITNMVIQERMIPTDEISYVPAGESRECLVWASLPSYDGTGYLGTTWGFVITRAKRSK